eukprot:TRINITY_DN1380_c0_g1_i1.p1 TRINITY_DN1380_c0_g1~~TRINITY_DN1380_c0_g1_i1.p1  ORF type:complete len:205 (-),score=12.70 TRINITY_DN1380_c0_g1_i1:486-1100(-)
MGFPDASTPKRSCCSCVYTLAVQVPLFSVPAGFSKESSQVHRGPAARTLVSSTCCNSSASTTTELALASEASGAESSATFAAGFSVASAALSASAEVSSSSFVTTGFSAASVGTSASAPTCGVTSSPTSASEEAVISGVLGSLSPKRYAQIPRLVLGFGSGSIDVSVTEASIAPSPESRSAAVVGSDVSAAFKSVLFVCSRYLK